MSEALPRYYHSVTDVGRQREANEDSRAEYALGDGGVLLVVADGMGGHENGEVASRIAVETVGQIFQNSPAPDPREKLKSGMLVANQRIVTEAEKLAVEGMGTTAVAAYVRGNQAYVAHVGDSRLYHVRDGQLLWRTTDHTRVQKMVEMGILSADDAKDHPDANVVSRALGFAQLADGSALEPEVQESPIDLRPGDSLVLCTDGLYDGVTDVEVAGALAGRTAADAARYLVDLANERGGHDNITVTVMHYGKEKGASAGPPSSKSLGPGSRRVTAAEPGGATVAPTTTIEPAEGSRRALALVLALVGLGLAAGAGWWFLRSRGKTSGGGAPPVPVADAAIASGAPVDAAEVVAGDRHDGGGEPPPGVVPGVLPSGSPRPKKPRDGGVAAAGRDGGAGSPAGGKDAGAGGAQPRGDGGLAPRGGIPRPTPSASPAVTPKPTASPSGSPKPTASPSGSPKPTASPSGSPKPTSKPRPSPSASPSG